MDNSELFSLDDYQLEKDNEDYFVRDDDFSTDLFSLYLNDISEYPLLTYDEEVKYATMLLNSKNNKLLVLRDIDRFEVSSLNIPLFFCSLINCSPYDTIINSLLELYGKLNSHSKDEDILYNYKRLSNKLNRPLNKDELKEIFNITDEEILDEKELLNEIKKFINYKFAFDKMYVSNLRLVIKYAKQYQNRMELMDLINEGNLGLIKAVQRFDITLGNRFSTYATPWIKEYITRSINNNNTTIRLPEATHHSISRFKKDVEKLEKELGRTLSTDEIANYLSMSVEEVIEYKKIINMYGRVSLDQPIGEEDDLALKDTLPSKENIDDKVMQEALKDDIKILFGTLTEKEKEVITLRFGLNDGKQRTLREVAKILSVSPQNVRQAELKAIYKMKRYAQSGKHYALKIYLK